MTIYEDFCREESVRRGIDPDTAVTVANSEGSLTEPARRGTFSTGSSWWAFQLHYGGAGYEYLGTIAGMGNDFTRITGWAPGDPAAWRDAMRFALDHVKAYGWGAWYGARARGITGFDGVDDSVPWAGTPDSEWDYLAHTPGDDVPTTDPAPTYDATTPQIQQPSDWDCSCLATWWALTAYGRHPALSWIEQQMVSDGIASHEQGLLDASGASLAAWIVEQYGEYGYGAYNLPSVTFNDVMVNAGLSPMLIGGRAWNHWSGVRRYNQSSGLLELANPANGWKDVWQTMDRAQFERLGPFSAVVVTWGGQPPRDQGLSIATLQAQVNELSARVTALTQQRDGLISAVAYLGDTMADSLTALAKEAQRVRSEQVGPRP